MTSRRDAPNSNNIFDHQVPRQKQLRLDDSKAKFNFSINVSDFTAKYPILDETTKPKTRRIHPHCVGLTGFGSFYSTETCDVNFILDVDGNEEVVPAHKCILAYQSPVFRQMFYGELKEKGDIRMTDTYFTVEAFIDFLKSIYNSIIVDGCDKSKMSQMVYLAHKYDVNWLELECKRVLVKIIEQDTTSVLWILPLANLYSYDELQRACRNQIRIHGVSIITSDEFVDCDAEEVEEILCTDFLHRNEVSIFKMCIRWAERACEKVGLDLQLPENIREQIGDCFHLIRFESMTMAEFMQCLSINPGVFTLDEIQQYAKKTSGSEPHQEQQQKLCTVKSNYDTVCSVFRNTSAWQSMFEDKETADVTFVLKNSQNQEIEQIPAHKCVLAWKSNVFAQQFRNSTNLSSVINISGVSTDAFKDFLRLFYVFIDNEFVSTYRIRIAKNIPEQHIYPILSMAKSYNVYYMITLYKTHLSTTMSKQNVIWRFELACKHSLDEHKTECVDFLKKNGAQFIGSDEFLNCSQENLKAILELHIWDNEKSLIAACIKWAKKYCRENKLDATVLYDLRTALGDAFELIPFSKMDPIEFIDFQRDYGDLFTGDEIKKLLKQVADHRNERQTLFKFSSNFLGASNNQKTHENS